MWCGDVVGVIGIFRAAVVIDKAGQVQPRAQIAEHGLEAAHVAVGVDHGPADRVGHGVRLADRAVEQADAVMPFEIGRVGQDQVGIGHHLGAVGIGIDDARDDIVAVRVLVGQHLDDAAGVHGGVPRHVRHVHEQRVDLVGIARVGVGDDHVHQAMRRQRVFPGEGLVDAGGVAVGQAQILRALEDSPGADRRGRAGVTLQWGLGCAVAGLG